MTAGTASLAELFADTPEELRRRALSHSSWVEHRKDAYGRLAFLGDSVLGLAIASELFKRHPDADIGELTRILNQAVSQRACVEVANAIDLTGLMREHAPQQTSGIDVGTLVSSDRTIASVCEAVIGACYLEHGFDATASAVIDAFEGEIEYARRERLDFKSELQERLARDGTTVSYEVTSEEGPPHDRVFEVRATVAGEEVGAGSGRSKKEAEQAAAERALERVNG
jgi:ribonuclease III